MATFLDAQTLQAVIAVIPGIILCAIAVKIAERENRFKFEKYAFELAITGKVSDLKTARHLVRKHFDYTYQG